jgi:hypothetical protein
MTDQDNPSAGAILLAAYFGIDTSMLEAISEPLLVRFPALTSAMLWNIVKLSREADNSIAEIAATTGIDMLAVEEAEKCINALEAIARHKNAKPAKKDTGGTMTTQWRERHVTNLPQGDDLDIAAILNGYNSILQFVENIVEQSELPAQVVITLQKRIYQFRRHQSYPHLSVAAIDAFSDEKSTFSNALPQTEQEHAARKLRRYRAMQRITEKLLHLMGQLIKDLQASLLEQQENYISREQALQREIIPNFSVFAEREHKVCQKSITGVIDDAAKALKKLLNESRDGVWSNIISSLNQAESGKDFEYFSRWTVSTILHEENDKLRKQLDQITIRMQQEINNATESSQKQFNDAYQKLLSVEYKGLSLMMVMDDPGEYLIFGDTLSELAAISANLHQSDDWKTIGNINLEAMTETFIAPGIGTLAGTTLGNFLGSFSLSVEKKREILREKLEPEIDQLYKQLQKQLDDALHNYEGAVYHSLDQQMRAYIRRYKGRVEALNVLHKHELHHLQQAMQSYLQQIKRYEETLQELRQKLAKTVK